jgi:hypothetical protein
VDGSCHRKEGFQVSKRGKERESKGFSKGSEKARGLRHMYCDLYTYVYTNVVVVVNNNLNCV